MELKKNIRTLRKGLGFTQTDLAKKIGTTQKVIADYEAGTTKPPVNKLTKLAEILSVSIDQLVGVKEIKNKNNSPKSAHLRRKLDKVPKLPKDAQKTIIKMIDALSPKK